MKFIIFLIASLLLHFLLFLFQNSSENPIFLAKKGDPVEISSNQSKKETITSKGTENNTTSETKTPPTKGGVTDGSEFGILKPTYPESSRLRGEEGRVLVRLVLDSKNFLIRAEVQESSGYPELDRAALKQIERDIPTSNDKRQEHDHLIQFNFSITTSK